nr:MAG TPA: hypothetical protein [Caudoviricetes sp.]
MSIFFNTCLIRYCLSPNIISLSFINSSLISFFLFSTSSNSSL